MIPNVNALRRGPLLPVILAAGALVIAYLVFVDLWTDKLWFDALSFAGVFSTLLVTEVGLFAGVAAVMTLAIAANMLIAFRMRPRMRRTGASPILDRYREILESRFALATWVPSLAFGVMAGFSAQSAAVPLLAWLNRVPFGSVDPYFGLDLSFYVFEYPMWRLAAGFAMTTLVVSLLGAATVHFAVGGLGPGGPGRPAGRGPASVHLSVLTGLIVALFGVQNLLDRYGYLLNEGTLFTGVHYTDLQARFNARMVVAVIAFIVAALFVANAFWNRLIVPVAGVVLMIVSSLLLSVAYPAVVQSFQVKPNEPDKERPFMQAHIEMTRQAYGINDIGIQDYEAVTQVQPGQLKQDAAALPGIRLFDPAVVGPTFDQLQQVRGYYTFAETLDVDRYTIDGVATDAVVAARELDLTGVPDANWNNIHTVYTHGYGLVAAYGNRRQSGGEPEWIVRDIPPVGKVTEYEPRIYYGERTTQFVIVGREPGQAPIELDTPGGGAGGGEVNNVYAGSGGVPIGDMVTRLLYATKFGDLNLVLSDRVNTASKLLYNRTPRSRVEQVAPWLVTDENIYPSVVDGRVVWIVDGYTTSSNYPNSQLVSLRSAAADAQNPTVLSRVDEINYIRNSVKAVVDAADGSVSLYAWDETDPLLRSYAAAFPGTVKPKSDISPDLQAHLRYPEDLFKVQRQVLSRYHMDQADTWYKQTDLWTVPNDPVQSTERRAVAEPPYFLSIKWPGDTQPVFSQTAVFVPKNRENLASYLAANSDASSPDYGKLRVLRMSDTRQIDGPGQTFNAINTDQRVAELLRPFLNQGSASATYGNLLTLPMGNGLLYVMPIYTVRQGSTGSYPALRFVVVRFGAHVGIGATLQEALNAVFQGDAGATTGETGTPSPSPTSPTPAPTTPTTADPVAAAAAAQRAETAFAAAEAALRGGDLALYQQKMNEARQAVAEALKALGR